MSRKSLQIRYKKERVLLSETLPFEIPVTFSNRMFYDFVVEHKIQTKGDSLEWERSSPGLNKLILLLFGLHANTQITRTKRMLGRSMRPFCSARVQASMLSTLPYTFFIKYREQQFRELSICHPINQLKMVEFYDNYRDLILYYSQRSEFSIRKPVRRAKQVFFKDSVSASLTDHNQLSVEEVENEYKNLRSYFAYEKYNNIFKFYESPEFHRCEKKFNRLLKLDISKCFDSIYTHSIAWAIHGKTRVKAQFLGVEPKSITTTFSGKFDALMQSLNAKETNGIIIGPEFSRIFAELILQSIDRNVLKELSNSELLIQHGKDFQIFRYIDDYFIFYNDDAHKDHIVEALQVQLRIFKLSLNQEKAKPYEKPIITEISSAKEKITDLLTTICVEKTNLEHGPQFRLSINATKLITRIKMIIGESGATYRDVQNWSLAMIETRFHLVSNRIMKTPEIRDDYNSLRTFIWNILELSFFIYSVSPRVNTTIRLCRIISQALWLVDSARLDLNSRHVIYSQIYENCVFALKKFRSEERTQNETLYLIIQLRELGKRYELTQSELVHFFNIDSSLSEIESCKLNHFSLVTILLYIKDSPEFGELREFVSKVILARVEQYKASLLSNSEITILLFDSLSCPFLSNALKRRLLRTAGIYRYPDINEILALKIDWFTSWRRFDFKKALDTKKSLEVY